MPADLLNPEPPAPAPAGISSYPWYFLGLLVFLFFSFGGIRLVRHFLPAAVSMLPGGASGTISVTGKPENWVMNVSSCYSGERRSYFGASFFDSRQPRFDGHLDLQIGQPERIVLNTPTQGGSVILSKNECDLWDVDLHHTSSTYNGIWAVSGHARFDCTFDDPVAHFTGDIQLHSCH